MFDGYWEDIGTVGSFWECNLSLTDALPPFDFFDSAKPIYTNPRVLPAAKINGAQIHGAVVSDGCILTDCSVKRCSLGVRSVIREGARLENVVMLGGDRFECIEDIKSNDRKGVPNIGVGRRSVILHAIIDKDARIGDDVFLSPFGVEEKWETPQLYVRDGVIIVKKNAVIPSGTRIGREA